MSAYQKSSHIGSSGQEIPSASRQEQRLWQQEPGELNNHACGAHTFGPNEIIDAIQTIIIDNDRDCSLNQKEIINESVEMAIAMVSNSPPAIFLPALPAPVRELSPADEISVRKIGGEHPWDQRAPSDNRSPAEWIRDFYGAWIPSLLKDHIKLIDEKLYRAFLQYSAKHELPEALDIPSACENAARRAGADKAGESRFIALIQERLGNASNLGIYRVSEKRKSA